MHASNLTGIGRGCARSTPDAIIALMIRVMHVGVGPIGALVARQIASRKGFRIVAAVDVDPEKAGRDLGDVIEAGRKLRVKVTDDIGRTIKATKPDVAVLCTSSSLKGVLPQFEEILKRRIPIVTTTEEAAYPAPRNLRLAKRLDVAAKKAKVAVLGTGVNPGFTMDALPIALSAVCERVDRIEVQRVQSDVAGGSRMLRRLGFGPVLEQIDDVLEVDFAVAQIANGVWRRAVRRPGRGGRPDTFYAQWAQRYVDHNERPQQLGGNRFEAAHDGRNS